MAGDNEKVVLVDVDPIGFSLDGFIDEYRP
jgi:hypothetical protein